MDLFDFMCEQNKNEESPLAVRMRPKTLEEMVGQEHIIGKDKLLYRAIKSDRLSSLIFYGPPGTGKTTLAKVIANTTKAEFRQINATTASKKDMEEVVMEAKTTLGAYNKKTILFVDEIHRFNKGQQDFLLSYVEEGTIVLIGATTENPYFEVNSALLSRSNIFELKPLSKDNIKDLVKRAVYDVECGMGAYGARITDEAIDFIADMSDGDARNALNAVELAVTTTEKKDGFIDIDINVASECMQRRVVDYDKKGEGHYDTISAFIKSMRGSDPDAAVYYLARMLYAGEDIKFIARRIMICASEDVGMADPNALNVAVSACLACERVGMPEARIILSEAAVYVACAPKSNSSYNAINSALDNVAKVPIKSIPRHLQNVHADSAGEEREQGYLYAHDYDNHYVKQQYLPDELVGERFYLPGTLGHEADVREHFRKLDKEF